MIAHKKILLDRRFAPYILVNKTRIAKEPYLATWVQYAKFLKSDVYITSWYRSVGPHYNGRSIDIAGLVRNNEITVAVRRSTMPDILLAVYKYFDELVSNNIVSQIITPVSIYDLRLDGWATEPKPKWAIKLIADHSDHIHITIRKGVSNGT